MTSVVPEPVTPTVGPEMTSNVTGMPGAGVVPVVAEVTVAVRSCWSPTVLVAESGAKSMANRASGGGGASTQFLIARSQTSLELESVTQAWIVSSPTEVAV